VAFGCECAAQGRRNRQLGPGCQAGACAARAAEPGCWAAVAARWGEQDVGPACQSEVGSVLHGLESEREVGESGPGAGLVQGVRRAGHCGTGPPGKERGGAG
jgi:hypothetical protein